MTKSEKTLVIVESPTKAKTINRFLDERYHVESSYGHIRDLPSSKLGIDTENEFAPHYIIPRSKSKVVKELKKRNVPVIYIVKDNETHSFKNPKNKLEFYRQLEKFLEDNLKKK